MSDDERTRIIPEARADLGTQLSGIYELDERIALGGMGEVYRGHNIQTGDPVAIKIVLPEFARDETILSLFKKEASILNHLSHEAIVRYHVFTIDPVIKLPYLAMEFVNGQSVIDFIQGGPMPADDAWKLGRRVASGLAAAHEAGVIHRDLSPDNIILQGGKVEHAKIIDFGIARSAMVGGKTLLEGQFAGKYNYVSPEQVGLFGGEVTERSDIYSLGLVLAAAALGEPIDMNGTQLEIIEKRRKVPDLSLVDERLRPLLEAMLQPDPKDRPVDMNEIVAWLSGSEPKVPPRNGYAAPGGSGTYPPASGAGHAWQTSQDHAADAPTRPGAGAHSPNETGAPQHQASESPFGPYVPPPQTPFTSGVTGVFQPDGSTRARKSRTGLIVGVAALVLVSVGAGGAYYAGLFAGRPAPSAGAGVATGKTEQTTPTQQSDAGTAKMANAENEASEENALGTSESPTQAASTAENASSQSETEASASNGGNSDRQEAALHSDSGTGTAATVGEPSIAKPEEAPRQDVANVIDSVAMRVSWVRNYTADGCFYASAISVSDKAAEIEGFGRSIDPFTELLKDFRATFHIEPEIGARIIEPEQCVITDFLRGVGNSSATPPVLTLDQTDIADGAEVDGHVARLNGRKADLILIDHKGMAYSLNQHLTRSGSKAQFSINVGLAASDHTDNDSVPQVIVAVVSRNGIKAAEFSRPVRAEHLFPRILSEIKESDPQSTAIAKYFRLGG